MLKIDKNVPLPTVDGIRNSKYSHLMHMKVGDSVALPDQHTATAVAHFLRRNKRKAIQRAVAPNGFRVWRIK